MRVFEHGEAARIAHHLQNMLIDRVDMKQVVLHLADDALERWNHAPQDAPLVHSPQLVRDATRRLNNL